MLWPSACTGHHLEERSVVLIAAALLNNLSCELYKLTKAASVPMEQVSPTKLRRMACSQTDPTLEG